jgi:TRAP-type mannitol/chloroaromatic compound transport system substrate-binding protein
MKRRKFLEIAAKGAVGGVAMGLAAACTSNTTQAPTKAAEPAKAEPAKSEAAKPTDAPAAAAPAVVGPAQSFEWNLATSWPKSLDTIFGGAEYFAQRVGAMTGGKFKITPRPAGDPQGAPGTQVLDVVSQGAVPMGHTADYYYIGKSWVCAFSTAIPFGLNLQQQNSWLMEGGGLQLIQEVYAKKFNVIVFPAGNTSCQWGGWWREELKSLDALKGKKMRIPGIGGQVMKKLGVNTVTLPGGEIFQALQTGTIDSAEWVGPYDDEKLGFYKVAKVFHYPGWWEPAPTLMVQVNLNKWKELPEEYKQIVQSAAYEANLQMPARYDARSHDALDKLLKEGVQVIPFPKDVLEAARKATFELVDEQAAKDPDVKKVYDSWKAFRDKIYKFHSYSENALQNFAYGK